MRIYRVIVTPNVWAQELTVAGLQALLADTQVSIDRRADGRLEIAARMRRPDHGQALDEVAYAVETLGWRMTEAVVQEWLGNVAQAMVLAAAGGVSGGRVSPDAAFLCALVGAAVGLVAPSVVRATEHEALRTTAGWRFRQTGGMLIKPGIQGS